VLQGTGNQRKPGIKLQTGSLQNGHMRSSTKLSDGMDQDAQTTFPPVSQDLIMVTDLSANRYSTDQFQGHLFPSQVLGDDPPI